MRNTGQAQERAMGWKSLCENFQFIALTATEKVHSDRFCASPLITPLQNLLHLPSAHRQECLCYGTFSVAAKALLNAGNLRHD